jgi:hypothetical protein
MQEEVGMIMNISEKIGLYEFCKRESGSDYHNLSTTQKESVKKQYFGKKENGKKRRIRMENRKIDLRIPIPEGVLHNLGFQG